MFYHVILNDSVEQHSRMADMHVVSMTTHLNCFRHWQELGYLIIYITGRPDMQQQKVVSWLSQHNFPHGLVSFADGLSTDPLGHKATYLKNLIQVCT
jgi:LNS2 (Lipin/Ned1/Smp2).